ncbi:hypothetical protein LTR86_002068 [Recurvomyces mirabilis]|nr:hypothetical protein LTR86_002068 [Recurvomyces mirabilis]
MPPSAEQLKGACACGAVSWQATADPQHLDLCYCKTCQQISGAPFVAWTGIPKQGLTWHGPITTFAVNDLATRSYCQECGSTLSMHYHCYPDKIHVAAGTVTDGEKLLPPVNMHIFISRKPQWYTLPDDKIEKWDEFDTETQKMLDDWRSRQGST